jgi:hypothetical protein
VRGTFFIKGSGNKVHDPKRSPASCRGRLRVEHIQWSPARRWRYIVVLYDEHMLRQKRGSSNAVSKVRYREQRGQAPVPSGHLGIRLFVDEIDHLGGRSCGAVEGASIMFLLTTKNVHFMKLSKCVTDFTIAFLSSRWSKKTYMERSI